ncbi:hypothetical protein [Chitinophaga niabensis]|uniref:Uncharacterized protein n=1 Tax=Chitinophaga niabensis TaxID=536979 RepID=A0A1N6K7A4_9BACT|nr:hypothetical protein [Chitinophaga niabensis]SIO52206.1 hypothetical protein SAMN04488055_5188 [Chitinophaga niabensis]
MTRAWGIFWSLYMLFFAVPFPMILYYNIKSESADIDYSNPWVALGVLLVSIILWGILLWGYFYKWILSNFIAKRNFERLKQNGIPRTATILSSESVSQDVYDLTLSFKNLVNTEIIQKTAVNDGKPDEQRFEAGKKIDILIDKDMTSYPYFMFATSEAGIRKMIMTWTMLGWLALTALIIGYYVFSYKLESNGMGWRFISFYHPLFVCPIVMLGYRLFDKFISVFTANTDESMIIKFKGIRTSAKLLSASQTGTYINEQPMVRFELEFMDEHYKKHKASIKKLVDLLHLDVTRQEAVEIFYLKENPQQIAFASDLDEIIYA